MSPKPCRVFTDEQKADFSDRRLTAVRIVAQSGKSISQIAQEIGLSESALRNKMLIPFRFFVAPDPGRQTLYL